MPRHEAILEANHTRLRPILMTTVMLVAAMVPIALGQGPGAGARASMAKVIIGGQMLSLLLALLVTPVFYALLDMAINVLRRSGFRLSVEPRRPVPPEEKVPPSRKWRRPTPEVVQRERSPGCPGRPLDPCSALRSASTGLRIRLRVVAGGGRHRRG